MKREIKFRLWEEARQQMHYSPPEILFGVLNTWPDGKVIMQFTGLHDRVGKEIFEGDILRSEECLYEYGDKTVVFFYKGSFCGSFDYDVTPFNLSDVDMNEFEVVGNIFENQELLK